MKTCRFDDLKENQCNFCCGSHINRDNMSQTNKDFIHGDEGDGRERKRMGCWVCENNKYTFLDELLVQSQMPIYGYAAKAGQQIDLSLCYFLTD